MFRSSLLFERSVNLHVWQRWETKPQRLEQASHHLGKEMPTELQIHDEFESDNEKSFCEWVDFALKGEELGRHFGDVFPTPQ